MGAVLVSTLAQSITKSNERDGARLDVMFPYNARPALNLPNDALGYLALYPQFDVVVDKVVDFWSIAQHFTKQNQDWQQNRMYALLDDEYCRSMSVDACFGDDAFITKDAYFDDTPLAMHRFLMVNNYGVFESRVGNAFRVRKLELLNDVPTMMLMLYFLDDELHVRFLTGLSGSLPNDLTNAMLERMRQAFGLGQPP
jgi:hypothetical protein